MAEEKKKEDKVTVLSRSLTLQDKLYKTRPQTIKYGRWYLTELVLDKVPPRLIISPIPFKQAIDPSVNPVPVMGWFADAKTDKAWLKLVGITQHARTEKRVGIYLLYMCREYVKLDIDPLKLEIRLTPEIIRELVERFGEYEYLMINMELEDGMKRLRTYDMVTVERSKGTKTLAEDHAAMLLAQWSLTEKMEIPKKPRYGVWRFLPRMEDIKSNFGWIMLVAFLIFMAWFVFTFLPRGFG